MEKVTENTRIYYKVDFNFSSLFKKYIVKTFFQQQYNSFYKSMYNSIYKIIQNCIYNSFYKYLLCYLQVTILSLYT